MGLWIPFAAQYRNCEANNGLATFDAAADIILVVRLVHLLGT
jgi:hypothetical protein